MFFILGGGGAKGMWDVSCRERAASARFDIHKEPRFRPEKKRSGTKIEKPR